MSSFLTAQGSAYMIAGTLVALGLSSAFPGTEICKKRVYALRRLGVIRLCGLDGLLPRRAAVQDLRHSEGRGNA
jgi:hypothetical protein